MHLFDYLDSGNGYKARLLLAQLGLDYRWTEVDIEVRPAIVDAELRQQQPNLVTVPRIEVVEQMHAALSTLCAAASLRRRPAARHPGGFGLRLSYS